MAGLECFVRERLERSQSPPDSPSVAGLQQGAADLVRSCMVPCFTSQGIPFHQLPEPKYQGCSGEGPGVLLSSTPLVFPVRSLAGSLPC